MRTALALLVLAGCPKSGGQGVDHVQAINSALATGAALAAVIQSQAIANGDGIGCVVGGSVSAVAGAASAALSSDEPGLPETTIDLSSCVPLHAAADAPEGDAEVEAEAEPVVEAEPSVEEGAEEGAEAPAPDAQIDTALVNTILNAVLITTRTLIDNSQFAANDCVGHAKASAALGWIEAIAEPVTAEIDAPDGTIVVPALEFDLSACSTE